MKCGVEKTRRQDKGKNAYATRSTPATSSGTDILGCVLFSSLWEDRRLLFPLSHRQGMVSSFFSFPNNPSDEL